MFSLAMYKEILRPPVKRGPYKKMPKAEQGQRELSMAFLYKQGKTLQEIGEAYGLTRERVRQLLKRTDADSSSGGRTLKSIRKAQLLNEKLKKKRDIKAEKVYGCDHDTAISLNGGMPLGTVNAPARKYFHQGRSAVATRKIGWEITFPEWMKIWEESGHIHEMGRGKNKYCMARINDSGPYHPMNVYITTCQQNTRDYQASLKESGIMCADGFRRLPSRIEILLREADKPSNSKEQAA